MKPLVTFLAFSILTFTVALADTGVESTPAAPNTIPAIATSTISTPVVAVSLEYILRPGDVVQVKVYQEDDLTSVARIGKEGTISLPLVGAVNVVGNTLGSVTATVRDLLAKDYLVNPQVTVTVMEKTKHQNTNQEQVQRSGTYDMPPDDKVSLLQAVATAGGYTRIGNPGNITVQRTAVSEKKVFKLDADAMAKSKNQKNFEILPDDVIIVGEKWL